MQRKWVDARARARVQRFFFSSVECTSFFRCFLRRHRPRMCGYANVCAHTHRPARIVKILRTRLVLFSLSLLLLATPRLPQGLFKSKTSLSQPERILVSETLIITTRRRPDSRLSSVRNEGARDKWTAGRRRERERIRRARSQVKNGDESGFHRQEERRGISLTINLSERHGRLHNE